MSFTYKY